MPRFVAVSVRQYRGHELRIVDEGRGRHSVLIHRAGQAEEVEVPQGGGATTLAELVHRAKDLIDAVMGPRPPPRPFPARPRPGPY